MSRDKHKAAEMSDTIYKPPQSNVENSQCIEVPENILKKIESACIAGVISVGFTFIFIIISLFFSDFMGFNEWTLIDIVIVILLLYGIIKKSRVSAILLFTYVLINKVISFTGAVSLASFPITLIFLYFYAQGIIGTFQYHKFIKKKSA